MSVSDSESMSSQTEGPKHWILRIADGNHFWSSSKHHIWGINSKHNTKKFLREVSPGDILWFLTNMKNGGKLVACAEFVKHNERVLGPLVQLTHSNEELGWVDPGEWDIEVHYTNLYNLTDCDLFPELKGAQVVRPYNSKCKVNLPVEHPFIVRYSKAKLLA